MIKAGILGADTPDAGELIRLLVRHPEVDIRTLHAPSYKGRQVASCHYGMIGESVPPFTDKVDPGVLDVVFICSATETASSLFNRLEEWPELRVIDMSAGRLDCMRGHGMEYGLSEINRKPLVRGAHLAAVATAPAAVVLIALHPFALNTLLNSDIVIDVEMPEAMMASYDTDELQREICERLKALQPGFANSVKVRLKEADAVSAVRAVLSMRCALSLDEIEGMYERVYDDHSFTFHGMADADRREVEGSQKCVVSYSKPNPHEVTVCCVADGRLRGGAGDAVHLLNLFFALDEKVGLNLKPAVYGVKATGKASAEDSWFA